MAEMTFPERNASLMLQLLYFPELETNLCSQTDTEGIFSCMWELEEAHQLMSPTLIKSEKSEEEANRIRTEGNGYYAKKNFEKTLQLYNLSIMKAPHPVLSEKTTPQDQSTTKMDGFAFPRIDPAIYGGTTKGESRALAMSYANRSALMFEMGFYEKCLTDINRALNNGYPEDLTEKLRLREQKCLSALRKNQKMSNSSTTDGNDESQYSLGPVDTFDISESRISQKVPTLKDLLSHPKRMYTKTYEPNPNVPSLSSALRIAYTHSKGRGLVTTRDIRPGEVLGVERAFCIDLAKNKLSSICSSCMNWCFNPVPCPGCSEIIFCSESCREKGLAEDHWLECKILPTTNTLMMGGIGESYKLLRTFTYSHLAVVLRESHRQQHDKPETLGFNKEGVYDSLSFRTIFNLSTNQEKHPFDVLLQFSSTAMILTKLLEQSRRYFVDQRGEPVIPTKSELLQTGAVLLSCIMKKFINCLNCGTGEDLQGRCLFPAISLINHSCNPSLSVLNDGRECILRALRPISAGEEVTICYTGPYQEEEIVTRTRPLKDMYISCTCEACKNNWPTFLHLPAFRAECCKCKQHILEEAFICNSCLRQSNLSSGVKSLLPLTRKALKYTKSGERAQEIRSKLLSYQPVSKDDFDFICEFIEFVHENLTQPCQVLPFLTHVLKLLFKVGL